MPQFSGWGYVLCANAVTSLSAIPRDGDSARVEHVEFRFQTLGANSVPEPSAAIVNADNEFKLVTMTGNVAGNAGGAVFIQKEKYTRPQVQFRDSTIARNLVFGGRSSLPYGGGIAEGGFSSLSLPIWQIPFEISSSIVAENHVMVNKFMLSDDLHADVDAPSSGYNLIGAPGPNIGIVNGQSGNQIGRWYNPIDPKLSSLGLHGGTYSRNLVPASDSPAVNRGGSFPLINPGPSQVPYHYDQRGFFRLDRSDVGSIETNYQAR